LSPLATPAKCVWRRAGDSGQHLTEHHPDPEPRVSGQIGWNSPAHADDPPAQAAEDRDQQQLKDGERQQQRIGVRPRRFASSIGSNLGMAYQTTAADSAILAANIV